MLFNSLQKIQTLKTLKMLKFIIALLFAHVLLAAPLPQQLGEPGNRKAPIPAEPLPNSEPPQQHGPQPYTPQPSVPKPEPYSPGYGDIPEPVDAPKPPATTE